MSGVRNGLVVPPGHRPPFAPVTETDHRAWIIIATALGVAFLLVVLLVRAAFRRFDKTGWARDDTMTIVTSSLYFVQSSIVLAACAAGLGASSATMDDNSRLRVQQLYYASNIFYLLALDMSKLSGILFFHGLTSRGMAVRQYSNILMTVLPVSTLAFIIATSLQCDLAQPWVIVNQRCVNWFPRWVVHGIFESAFEVAMLVSPIWLVRNLQMPVSTKTDVVTPFALRLLVIALTGVRLGAFNSSGFALDPTLAEAQYITLTQAELSYSVISATFPSTRRFVVDLVTYYNSGGLVEGSSSRSRSGGGTLHDTIQMTPLRSGNSKGEVAFGRSRRGRSLSDDDDSSQDMIIRKNVSVDVTRESGSVVNR